MVVRQRHRLLESVPVLPGDLRSALDPRARARPSRPGWPWPGPTLSVGGHRRRRRVVIGGNHLIHACGATSTSRSCCSTTGSTADQGQYSPTSRSARSPSRHRWDRWISRSTRSRWRWARRRRSWDGLWIPTVPACPRSCAAAAHRGPPWSRSCRTARSSTTARSTPCAKKAPRIGSSG